MKSSPSTITVPHPKVPVPMTRDGYLDNIKQFTMCQHGEACVRKRKQEAQEERKNPKCKLH